MFSVMSDRPFAFVGQMLRDFRHNANPKLSLDDFADRIAREGLPRPSAAKLSRIETGHQPVPLDILDAVAEISGIPPHELRPDLARAVRHPEAAA